MALSVINGFGVTADTPWPTIGMFGGGWTAPRTPRPCTKYLHEWSGQMEDRLNRGDFLFPRNCADATFATTWEREHRDYLVELAIIFLDESHTEHSIAFNNKLFDLSVALGLTEAAIAAADGKNPNPAYFDKLAREDAARAVRARGIVKRGMAAFASLDLAAIGATMTEIVGFFYNYFVNEVDWSFKSHGAGPRLRLSGLPWTPAQAEQLAQEAWLHARALTGTGTTTAPLMFRMQNRIETAARTDTATEKALEPAPSAAPVVVAGAGAALLLWWLLA